MTTDSLTQPEETILVSTTDEKMTTSNTSKPSYAELAKLAAANKLAAQQEQELQQQRQQKSTDQQQNEQVDAVNGESISVAEVNGMFIILSFIIVL